jgi:hypothetical protein
MTVTVLNMQVHHALSDEAAACGAYSAALRSTEQAIQRFRATIALRAELQLGTQHQSCQC